MEDDPLFRRTRQHAELRLSFNSGQSDKQRIEQIKEFMRLEKEMLLRYHQKGDSGLRVTRARSVILDVLIQNLFFLRNRGCKRNHWENQANVCFGNWRLWQR